MTPTTALLARALALLERFDTGHGHLDNREGIDFRGVCIGHRTYDPAGGRRVKTGQSYQIVDQPLVGQCAPSCKEWAAVIAALRAEVEAREPRQLELTA